MPIEISTRKLKKDDLNGQESTYHAPYVPIYQYGYGRMDSSTPGQGLMTCNVASCLAIVLHCPTTGRTILTHSPNYLYMDTFRPIVDWITGGDGQDNVAWYAGLGARPCEVEVVVLRGFSYATAKAIHFGHDQWMQDFRDFFSGFTDARHIRLNLLDATQFLTEGAVLVDKDTARITNLEVKGRARPQSIVDKHLNVENPFLLHTYSRAQISRDLFVGALLGSQSECPPIFLQYDIAHYCLPMPLPDNGRQLIRSKRLGEPVASQKAIIKRFNQPGDWLDPSSITHNRVLSFCFLQTAIVVGPPCERCGKSGSKLCKACMGAWYCGSEHQADDWKSHKVWCKAHRILNSSI